MVEQGIRLTIVITTDYSVICSDYSSEDKKMQKYVEQIDKRTGEVMDGCMVWIPSQAQINRKVVYGISRFIHRAGKRPRANTRA